MGAIFTISKDSIIYESNQPVTEIAVILSGKVIIKSNTTQTAAGPGDVIAMPDFFNDVYTCDYITEEDSMLLPLSTEYLSDIKNTMKANQSIRAGLIISMSKLCAALAIQYDRLIKAAIPLADFLKDKQAAYLKLCENNLLTVADISFAADFLSVNATEIAEELIEYYTNLSKVSQMSADSFYSENIYISYYHFHEAYELAKELSGYVKELSEKLGKMHNYLIGTDGNTLFKCFTTAYTALNAQKKDSMLPRKCISALFAHAQQIGVNQLLLSNATNIIAAINNIAAANAAAEAAEAPAKEAAQEYSKFKENVTNALDKLIAYSGLSADVIAPFKDAVIAFRALPNKNASTDNVMNIRKTITKYFYQLYEAIFFKYVDLGSRSKFIELFLNTCFVDENLVSEAQLEELYNLNLKQSDDTFKVYTMYEWLLDIYKGNQEPSRNEFDVDYNGMVRERKRAEKLNETQVANLLSDKKGKVRYEIQNFFRSTHRITCGQIIGFCPILYSEYSDESFNNAFLSKDKISSIFNQYRQLDFSCFYRVVPYEVNKFGLTREYLQTEVTPYIILNPVFGQKGIMWQEISGTKRDTPARFSFPIFFRGDINTVVLHALGQYRWEFCKSVEGLRWNDIQQPSLTSEYYDYIQFYKKNSALSPEAKEKIKTILTKYHNNSKEVFANDYVTYMQYESTGASRLNKLSRTILFKYCTFDAKTRKNLLMSPVFKDMVDMHEKNCNTKLRRINSVINVIQNGAGEVPPEFEVNRDFYSL
ncbi:MAG: hypothetical protein J6B39_01290 [Lachnospiraceae bacterium]|nr:hypothetical protein [Lachnospiraceae bacterium]